MPIKKSSKTVINVKSNDSKEQTMKAAIEDIEKQFGVGAIMKMGENSHVQIERFPSGSLALDIALGGGMPKGRIIEIYGPESSGKTTLALHSVAQLQKQGGQAAFIDAEHALDVQYAKKIGVDVSNLLVSQPDDGESALEITEKLVRSGGVDLIIVDSVAALTPRAEIEGMMGDTHMGLQARLMSQALRKLTAIVAKSSCSVVFINQIRMKIGVMFGNPETTPGGNALKFYSSVRLDVRRIGKISDKTDIGEEIVGNRTRVKVVKNKVAPPFREAEFDVVYNKGIVWEGDILDLGVKYGIISKSGAFFGYEEEKLGQGRENAKKYFEQNPKITAKIEKEIRAKSEQA
ncbi:recombinase RecA [Candidatus Peribacteria bacterium]|jgi:recombination protein RecA|nr:recombinase RecA [Candidatus Peribacteria bacterium]MBT4020920.1 recombinase RecA [Candidatus Peribacteria bacterium]MBT4240478.1 recombinase RecA [Candidatus Peribacteria bacterium]MBT4474362.1 recombinase RecA [Candidatus Peribacteria bacterium]